MDLNKCSKIVVVSMSFIVLLWCTYCCGKDCAREYLGGNYYYYYEVKAIMGENSDMIDIPDDVVLYKYDSLYIIAKQIPNCYYDSIYNYREDFTPRAYSLGLDTVYYWIIMKKGQEVLGALLYDDYIKQMKILNITLNLD